MPERSVSWPSAHAQVVLERLEPELGVHLLLGILGLVWREAALHSSAAAVERLRMGRWAWPTPLSARLELKESRKQGTYKGGATTTTASTPGITAMIRGACRAWDKTETALAAAGDGEFTFMFTFSAFRSSCDLVVGGAAAAQHQHGHVPPAGEGRHQQVEAASPEATTHHAERPQDGREL